MNRKNKNENSTNSQSSFSYFNFNEMISRAGRAADKKRQDNTNSQGPANHPTLPDFSLLESETHPAIFSNKLARIPHSNFVSCKFMKKYILFLTVSLIFDFTSIPPIQLPSRIKVNTTIAVYWLGHWTVDLGSSQISITCIVICMYIHEEDIEITVSFST